MHRGHSQIVSCSVGRASVTGYISTMLIDKVKTLISVTGDGVKNTVREHAVICGWPLSNHGSEALCLCQMLNILLQLLRLLFRNLSVSE